MLDVTGPIIMARGFLEYFKNKWPIRPETYPNGVRLLKQELTPKNAVSKVFDPNLVTMSLISTQNLHRGHVNLLGKGKLFRTV